MATADDYFASRQCVWDDFGPSGNISVMVSQIRQSRTSDSIYQTLTHTIPNELVPEWLSSTQDHTNQKGYICLLRIVWFPYNRRQGKVDAGHGVLTAVTQAFNHQLAQSRLRATFAGVSSVTESQSGKKTHWFCNHPHLAVTWSRDPKSRIINVIFIAQPRKITMLQDLVTCRFVQELASAETFPALLCMVLLCREVDNLLIDVKNQVRQAEVRTGHHRFANRFEMPASGDLVQLSATMSGCMSSLAVLTRRLGVLAMMQNWTDDLAVEDKTRLASATAVLSTVQQHSAMQQLDIDFFIRRTQIQQDAMLHLIGEQGNLTSRDIAKDSHSLAMLARNDTSVMKGLAFLAVVFVPPAFVSSLLSIPLFDWGSPDESSKDTSLSLGTKILIYLSITGPLMLITFSVWGIFLYWERSRRKKRSNSLASSVFQVSEGRSETTSLIARRRLS